MIGLGSNKKWKNTEQLKDTFRSLWDNFGTTLRHMTMTRVISVGSGRMGE